MGATGNIFVRLVDIVFPAAGRFSEAKSAPLVLDRNIHLLLAGHQRQLQQSILHPDDAVLGFVVRRRHSRPGGAHLGMVISRLQMDCMPHHHCRHAFVDPVGCALAEMFAGTICGSKNG